MTLRNLLVFIAIVLVSPVPLARGFILLTYRTEADLLNNLGWWSWANPRTGQIYCPGGVGNSFTLSYRVDDFFMANQTAPVIAGAETAVINAIKSWEDATNSFIRFQEAPWGTVTNCDTTTTFPGTPPCPQPCSVTRIAFEGPSFAEYNACTVGPPSFCAPVCYPNVPCPVLPGWGANIDVFTRPTGFVLCSNGFRYEMTANILAFTCVHRATGNKLQSVDIYLNECFRWQASNTTLAERQGTFPRVTCHDGCLVLDEDTVAHGPGGCPGGTDVYDIETVILHELGHALGLDHPNEGCAFNAAQLNPWTYAFQPCSTFSPNAVMNGVYAGVKRSLTNEDIGGISFLYRPILKGDLDSDGDISIIDALTALQFLDPEFPASPYEVNVMDFRVRNGRIDADEAMQVINWAIDPFSNRPDDDPELLIKEAAASGTLPPTSVSLDSTDNPHDIGLEPTYTLIITIDNPDAVRFTGWDIDVIYDPTIFSNPVLGSGTFLPSAAWATTGPDDGNIRFAKVGIGSFDNAVSGSLGSITFTVNLPNAAASPPTVNFTFTDVQLVADTPIIHNYGSRPDIPETLSLINPTVMSYRYDADANGVINLCDLYAYFANPFDVNKNMNITTADAVILETGIRRFEIPDILTGR
jgi:hypothetical protein